jgi:hypothetical protein
VSEDVIMKPITFEQIMTEQNAEIKRVMIERFGEDKFVESLGGEPVDDNPQFGKLYRIDYGDSEPLVLVRVECPSTGRIYFNQCPPEDDNGQPILRARQALAWRFSLSEEEYLPIVES